MAFIQIDRSGNFAIRLMHRTAFEFCDHFLMKFSLDNCSCVDHPELYRTNISLSNVEDCNGMSFSVARMKNYLRTQSSYMRGYIYYSKTNNEPVGYVWVAYRGANEFQYRIRTIDAFGFDFAVKNEYRGHGIVGFMIYQLLLLLQDEGIHDLYASVRKNNYAAISAYEKIGAVKVGRKRFCRFAGIRVPYPKI